MPKRSLTSDDRKRISRLIEDSRTFRERVVADIHTEIYEAGWENIGSRLCPEQYPHRYRHPLKNIMGVVGDGVRIN